MRSTIRIAVLPFVLCAAAQNLVAQSEDRAPNQGAGSGWVPVGQVQLALGDHVDGPYDVTTPTGWQRLLGVARAWGYYWVSGGNGTAGPFGIHQFDLSGNLLQTITQDVTGAATQWGIRDLAVDEAAFKLWGGMEGSRLKEYSFDPNTGPNGTLSFVTTYVIPVPAAGATIRALARNPNTGNFFTKNFNTDLYEFSIAGVPSMVNTFTLNNKASYGLAWDTFNNTLWSFDQTGPGGTLDLVEFNEVNPTNGTLTGRTFTGVTYGVAATNLAGGCDIFDDGSGFTKIVGLHQFTADELNIYELDANTPPPTNYCTSSTTTNGCNPVMSSSGSPSVAASSGFSVICNQVEGAKQGIQFYGINGQAATPWASGSTSFLCVKLPTQRMPVQNSGGTANACDGSISTDFLAYIAGNPGALGAPFSAGDVVNFQTWFRDPPAPKTTNLSDGLEVTLLP